MLERVWSMMGLCCSHARLSVPYPAELARPAGEVHLDWEPEELPPSSHYVVCVDCGQRFAYDWNKMKVIKTRLKTAG